MLNVPSATCSDPLLLRTGFSAVIDDSPGCVVVRLQGDLDTATSAELRRTLASVLDRRPPRIVVDLAELDFIDSTGICALIGGFRRASEVGCPYVLTSPARSVLKALHLAGVDQMMLVEPEAS